MDVTLARDEMVDQLCPSTPSPRPRLGRFLQQNGERSVGWLFGRLRGIVSSRWDMRSLRANAESVSGMGVVEADQFLGETARAS